MIYQNNDLHGRDIELVGQLAALLGKDELRTSMRKVVAEEGLEPPTHGLWLDRFKDIVYIYQCFIYDVLDRVTNCVTTLSWSHR